MCVNCPQSRLCAAAEHLTERSAVGGASVTAACVCARPQIQESSTARSASATTGFAQRIMGIPAMVRKRIHLTHMARCFGLRGGLNDTICGLF